MSIDDVSNKKICFFSFLKKSKLKKIIVFSRDELKQYEMSQRFINYSNKLRFFLGDVRDKERLQYATKEVDIIIHAATIASPFFYRKYPLQTAEANVDGLKNLLNFSLNKNVKRILFFFFK